MSGIESYVPNFEKRLGDLRLELQDFSSKWKELKKDHRTFHEEHNKNEENSKEDYFDDHISEDEEDDGCNIGKRIKGILT